MKSATADLGVQRALGVIVLITIAWTIAMSLEVKRFETKKAILGRFESAVAALELATTPQRVQDILDQGDREKNVWVMELNTRMDFVFIVLYCTSLWLLANAYTSQSALPALTTIAIATTGAFDIVENLQLCREFNMIGSLAPDTVAVTRVVSLTKWTAFALALWLLAAHFWSIRPQIQRSSALLKLLALSTAAAAAVTTVGLFCNSAISLMALPLSFTIVLAAIMFFPLRRPT